MIYRQADLLAFALALIAVPSRAAQQEEQSSPCMIEYENHNQTDNGPLHIQEVNGWVTDPQQVAIPRACVGLFTEKTHKLVVITESGADGRFSLQRVPPGRYRLVVKVAPLCAANVPVKVVKLQRRRRVLLVHMKPRRLNSCSYGEAVQTDMSAKGTSTRLPQEGGHGNPIADAAAKKGEDEARKNEAQ